MKVLDKIAQKFGYVPRRSGKRGFQAAKINHTTAGWLTTPHPFDYDLKQSLRLIRTRSRDASINNDYVRRFLGMLKNNVVGPSGIELQARVKDDSGTVDTLASEAIEREWKGWGRYGNPEVTGTKTWVDVQRQHVENSAKDGEVLYEMRDNYKGNKYGFALKQLDPEQLDTEYNKKISQNVDIVMGVELNADRRPVAYHLQTIDSKSVDYYNYGGRKYVRIPANRIIHRFIPEMVWQTRGFPWMVSAMLRLNMLGGYEEAEVIAARVAATQMGFFSQDPSLGSGGFQGDGEQDELGDYTMAAEPGEFRQLPPGVSLQDWNPSHPNKEFGAFVKSTLRGISSGLMVSYNGLSNDLENVNFSSIRQGVLDEREVYKAIQEWMSGNFHDHVYRAWLRSALLRGAITVMGKPLKPERVAKYEQVTWQPRRWGWIDPLKDAKANETDVNNALKSRSQVIRESGRDPDDVWAEIAAENAKLEELGIQLNETQMTGLEATP